MDAASTSARITKNPEAPATDQNSPEPVVAHAAPTSSQADFVTEALEPVIVPVMRTAPALLSAEERDAMRAEMPRPSTLRSVSAATAVAPLGTEPTASSKGKLALAAAAVTIVALGGAGFWGMGADDREAARVEAIQARADARAAREAEAAQQAELSALKAEADAKASAAFEAAKASNRITPLGEFAQNYPTSPDVAAARELAQARTRQQDSAAARAAYAKYFDGELPVRAEDEEIESGRWQGKFDSNGDATGEGRIEFPSGDVFIGRMGPDGREYGRQEFENGDVYVGAFKGIYMQGQGVMTYANGTVYKGAFNRNDEHGAGEMTGADYTYKGSFVRGTWTGQGRYEEPKNDFVFEGEFKDNNFNGDGRATYKSGNVYVGEFRDDNRHGQGRMTFASGNIYTGEWRDGKKHGQGKFIYADDVATEFEGRFVDDQRTGFGILRYRNGDVYSGDFLKDQRTGKGKMVFNDGNIYEGDFLDGEITGIGTIRWADGSVQTGRYLDGAYQGEE